MLKKWTYSYHHHHHSAILT